MRTQLLHEVFKYDACLEERLLQLRLLVAGKTDTVGTRLEKASCAQKDAIDWATPAGCGSCATARTWHAASGVGPYRLLPS
jgi:hypothetical protein